MDDRETEQLLPREHIILQRVNTGRLLKRLFLSRWLCEFATNPLNMVLCFLTGPPVNKMLLLHK